jgi:hypothetical protein
MLPRCVEAERTNTTVTGAGPYTITKSGGVAATFDADAVSLIGFTGDFLLTLSTSNAALAGVAGMNSDPATDANYTSIDRALSFGGDGNIRAFENGSLLTLYGAYSIANTYYIRRVGTAVTALVSTTGNFANATVLGSFNPLAGTLYFDSSLSVAGSSLVASVA